MIERDLRNAPIIKYDFKIENVNITSPHFHIELFNFSKKTASETIWPYITIALRFSPENQTEPEIGFYAAEWDSKNHTVKQVFKDMNIGKINTGTTYNTAISWIDNKVVFYLDEIALESYTFAETYSFNENPYNIPGYMSYNQAWVPISMGDSFKWTIDNIYTDVNYSLPTND